MTNIFEKGVKDGVNPFDNKYINKLKEKKRIVTQKNQIQDNEESDDQHGSREPSFSHLERIAQPSSHDGKSSNLNEGKSANQFNEVQRNSLADMDYIQIDSKISSFLPATANPS